MVNAKRDYISDILNRDDKKHKKMWKNIQQFLPNKKSNSTISKIENKQSVITKKSDQIAHTLNDFFGSIGKNLAEKINSHIDEDSNLPPVAEALTRIDHISAEKVKKLIDELSPYKSMGTNGFSTKLVKDSAQTIAPLLAHIIKSCIDSCSIPKEWKHAKITPIYKEGCKTSPSNYRPISVLPFISKLMEKVLHQSLLNHIENNNILTVNQAGFRKNKSTASMLTKLTDACLQNMDNSQPTVCVFIDLKKAFDTICHKKLIKKLEQMGIKGDALKIFIDYLNNRHHTTIVCGKESSPHALLYGVPQGSILGPILFTLYINDISSMGLNSDICLFADDTALLCTGPDILTTARKMQKDLNEIAKWTRNNTLTINAKKTKYMIVSTSHKSFPNIALNLNHEVLDRTRSYKYLGVILDENLTYKDHINHVATTVNNKTRTLRRLSHFLPKKIIIMLYKSLIPHLDYAAMIWGSASTSQLQPLQDLQTKTLIQLVKNSEIDEQEVHTLCNISLLKHRRNEQLAIITFNILQRDHDSYLIKPLGTANHPYATRGHELNLVLPKPNTNSMKRTVTYRGIQTWNELPNQTRLCENKQTLKRCYGHTTNHSISHELNYVMFFWLYELMIDTISVVIHILCHRSLCIYLIYIF